MTIKYIQSKYLRFDVKGGFVLFMTKFLVPQNHTADAIFNFLTTLPKGETLATVVFISIILIHNIEFR